MFLFKLKDKRFCARLRSDFPCLVPALLIALGEVLGLGNMSLFGWVTCGILASLILKKSWRNLFFIALGGVAVFLALPKQVEEIKQEVVAVGKIDDVPRRFVPEEVTLSVRLLSAKRVTDYGKLIPIRWENVRLWCRAVYVPWRNIYNVKQGDILNFRTVIIPFSKDKVNSYKRRGYHSACKIYQSDIVKDQELPFFQRYKNQIARNVREVLGDGERSAFFLAASIGYRDLISKRVEYDFKRTGLSHLLVLSGYQITLMFYFIYTIINLIIRISGCYIGGWGRQLPSWIALIGTVCFICLAGIEGPSIRAGVAALVVVLASTLERSNGMLHSITVAFLVLELVSPASFLDPGVQLTFAALGGICAALQWQNSDSLVKAYFRVCSYGTIFTMPIIIYWFGYFSLIGLICNPIFAPIISILGCKIGFVAIFLNYVGLDSNGWLLKIVSELLFSNSELVRYFANLSWAGWKVKGIWQAIGVIVSLISVVIIFEKACKIYSSKGNLRF